MRLATFEANGSPPRSGMIVDDEIVDLTDPVVGLPEDLVDVLALGASALDAARSAARSAAKRWALADVRLRAPLRHPPSFLALGKNYADHIAEFDDVRPSEQLWFTKQSTCVVGPTDDVWVPRVSRQVDYEGELAFVIGRRCRHVPVEHAFSVIAGFMVVNDVSVRDWQIRSPTMIMGKGFDTHGPSGPWIVTADEIVDPHALAIRTWVNDELRQDGNTDQMITNCWEMVAHLTAAFTLVPGTIVTTGTPSGVGMGFDPPRWLCAGDTVRVEIEGVGRLENPVVAEPENTATASFEAGTIGGR